MAGIRCPPEDSDLVQTRAPTTAADLMSDDDRSVAVDSWSIKSEYGNTLDDEQRHAEAAEVLSSFPPASDYRPSSEKKDHSKTFGRKFEKKLHFYAKVKDVVVSLGVKKAIGKKKRLRSRQKKLKAYDLSALSEFLPVLDAPPIPSKDLKLNCKSRHTLLLREAGRMKAVLNDPALRIDPFLAIHQHLERTQPPPPVVTTREKQQKGRKRKKDKRKVVKGQPWGSQSMDI